MIAELVKQSLPELLKWQLLVTHSVAVVGWDKVLKGAAPAFDFKRRHFNAFPTLGNCGENSLPVSLIRAVFEVPPLTLGETWEPVMAFLEGPLLQ